MAKRLGGEEALAGGDDPAELAPGLEGEHVVEIEEEVFLAAAANDFARSFGAAGLG